MSILILNPYHECYVKNLMFLFFLNNREEHVDSLKVFVHCSAPIKPHTTPH